jgi:hypothetical protein
MCYPPLPPPQKKGGKKENKSKTNKQINPAFLFYWAYNLYM